MSDFVTSLIRTYTPMIVGGVVSFLTAKGLDIPEESVMGVTTFLTVVISGAYYGIVRFLETRYPAIGILLGKRSEPKY